LRTIERQYASALTSLQLVAHFLKDLQVSNVYRTDYPVLTPF
jgi:hypothetical protein